MSYCDEHEASVSRLVALELEFASRRGQSLSLREYRADLVDERERLEHAILWYRNGERFGWHSGFDRDDLAPAEPAQPQLPGAVLLASRCRHLSADEIALRSAHVEGQLARGDWQLGRLRFACDNLQRVNAALRSAVEVYAGRYPDHPPPPAVKVGAAEMVMGVTASVGGLWVALMLLTALIT